MKIKQEDALFYLVDKIAGEDDSKIIGVGMYPIDNGYIYVGRWADMYLIENEGQRILRIDTQNTTQDGKPVISICVNFEGNGEAIFYAIDRDKGEGKVVKRKYNCLFKLDRAIRRYLSGEGKTRIYDYITLNGKDISFELYKKYWV